MTLELRPAIPTISRVLGISNRFAYKLIKQGVIPVVRVGPRWRVDEQELLKFIKRGGTENPVVKTPAARPVGLASGDTRRTRRGHDREALAQ